VCVWAGRVSAYHLVEYACLDGSDGGGGCGMPISLQERKKEESGVVFIKQSVCLAIMFLYTSNKQPLEGKKVG